MQLRSWNFDLQGWDYDLQAWDYSKLPDWYFISNIGDCFTILGLYKSNIKIFISNIGLCVPTHTAVSQPWESMFVYYAQCEM